MSGPLVMISSVDNLVLLHGFTQTGASWLPVRELLPERYRVLAPDIRGHGERSDVRPINFDACVGDIDALVAGRFTLVGYSMGGRLALAYALKYPQRLDRLVLVSSSPGIEDPAKRSERKRSDDELAERLDSGALTIEQFAQEWGGSELFSSQSSEVAAAAHLDRLRNEPSGLAASLRGIGTGAMEPLWARLGELEMPTTLVVGELDAKFREINTKVALQLPDAAMQVVSGVGHAVHLESPRSVGNALE